MSTVDALGGWELLGTLGTVVDVATVEPVGPAPLVEAWVRWDRPSLTMPRQNIIHHVIDEIELVVELRARHCETMPHPNPYYSYLVESVGELHHENNQGRYPGVV